MNVCEVCGDCHFLDPNLGRYRWLAWAGRAVAIGAAQGGGRKEAKVRGKFEELIAALYEFDYWIENWRQIEVYGKEIPPEVSPFCQIEAIVAVYFPQFIERIAAR